MSSPSPAASAAASAAAAAAAAGRKRGGEERVSSFLGVGIYSISEAARLTHVSRSRIRRWLKGYTYRYRDELRESAPVWRRQLPEIEGTLALGFRDLLEVLVIDSLRGHGVSWNTIRSAAVQARALFGDEHPFSNRSFKTDGRLIFVELRKETGENALLEITKSQYVFEGILRPYLKGVEFSGAAPILWHPVPKLAPVVLDPLRQFGQPILQDEGIQTAVLYRAYQAEESIERVASWFEVDRRAVKAAVAFERELDLAA